MTKRICWKKGMRLTDDILRASDNSTMELVGNALVLAAAGRFGLFPSTTSFKLSLKIDKGLVDVEQLNCLAVTKGGFLIDAHYDTKFTNTFDTRVQIPEGTGEKELILTIDSSIDKWKNTNDGFEEPEYSFSLIAPNSPLPANSLPIARIVDEYGWREDDVNFVPPCLYITSHEKYFDLKNQFEEVLKAIDAKAKNLLHSNAKEVVRVFWPVVQQLMIAVNKECDLMTPMELLANVQKCVSAFTCACELDDYINLADIDEFRNYVCSPYNYKDAYLEIGKGLGLCFSINEKVEKIGSAQPIKNTIEVPRIAQVQTVQNCSTPNTVIPVEYSNYNAMIFFTKDGMNPDSNSTKAKRTTSGFEISFNNGFSGNGKEPDKDITIKLLAIENGECSPITKYKITLKKNTKFREDIKYILK